MPTRTAAWLLTLGLCLAGCSERPPIVGAEPAETRGTRNVVVQGQASATSPPRVATFVASVEVWAEHPDAALRESEIIGRKLRGQLQNAGVRGTDLVDSLRSVEGRRLKDMSTRVVKLPSPVGELAADDDGADAEPSGDVTPAAEPPTHVMPDVYTLGYLSVESVLVTVRDPALLPKVLDRALTAGATQLGSVSWAPNNPDVLIEKVRQKAVQDARSRAQVLAQELGQAVGQANSIVELELVEPGDDPERPYEARCEVRIDFTLRSF